MRKKTRLQRKAAIRGQVRRLIRTALILRNKQLVCLQKAQRTMQGIDALGNEVKQVLEELALASGDFENTADALLDGEGIGFFESSYDAIEQLDAGLEPLDSQQVTEVVNSIMKGLGKLELVG